MVVVSDGSINKTQTEGGLGVVVQTSHSLETFGYGVKNDGTYKDTFSSYLMELLAIKNALDIIEDKLLSDQHNFFKNIHLHCDNKSVTDILNNIDNYHKNEFKNKMNDPIKGSEIWKEVYTKVKTIKSKVPLSVFFIAGHSNREINEIADGIAVKSRIQMEEKNV